ncbi:MAG: cell envelope biogenesis protein OmpA [Desulfobacterales bacterium RIFOXYA12_FULL_46_15]|nr:MAG: cell envelope biogenesis protein OmpA [Desulfobacterales bacterium RIFOXYA12_FULL_46_15]
MKCFTAKLFTVLAIAFLLSGCYTQKAVQPIPTFTLTPFSSNNYVSSIDNFVIVLDASSSMADIHKGNYKFDMATEIVSRMNQTLPELGQNGALRSFGHSPAVSNKSTVLFYGMEKYATKTLGEKLKKISEAGGTSPMHTALDASGQEELKPVSGKTAVIIISDGQSEFSLESPITLKAAQALKDQLGAGLCYYPIFVGNNEEGAVLMDEIARIGKCGFVSNADNLLTDAGMAQFVEDVFLSKKPMAPAAKAVAPPVAPAPPEIKGLNAQGVWVVDDTLFDFDKSLIKAAAVDYLDHIAEIMKAYPNMYVQVQGHTDSVGTKAYNDALSIRRAQAVKTYLINKGVEGERLNLEGFGFSKPVALNDTAKGRALNRRVELHRK